MIEETFWPSWETISNPSDNPPRFQNVSREKRRVKIGNFGESVQGEGRISFSHGRGRLGRSLTPG